MKHLIALEWSKVKWSIFIVLIAGTMLSVYLCSTVYKTFALEEQLEAWEIGMEIFGLLFPLLAVIPTGWLMYYERKNDFIKYTLPRTSKKHYLFAKWMVMSGSAFMIMFIISFAGVLTVLYIMNPIDTMYTWIDPETGIAGPSIAKTQFLGSLFTEQPLLYGFLLSAWRGLLTGIMATMGFVFSLYVRNLFIILTGPFIYSILENFILSILYLPGYRLVTSFEPTSISGVSFVSLLTGPFLAIAAIILFVLYMSFIKKSSVYTV